MHTKENTFFGFKYDSFAALMALVICSITTTLMIRILFFNLVIQTIFFGEFNKIQMIFVIIILSVFSLVTLLYTIGYLIQPEKT